MRKTFCWKCISVECKNLVNYKSSETQNNSCASDKFGKSSSSHLSIFVGSKFCTAWFEMS